MKSFDFLALGEPVRTASFLFLLIGLTFIPFTAHANSFYQVDNVRADVTADNAVKARQEALAEARQKAFKILKERLTESDQSIDADNESNTLDDLTISSLIKTLSIDHEQLSSTRYAATVSVTFDEKAVKSFFTQQETSYTTSTRAPFLILPWVITAGQARIWQDYTPWRRAWVGLSETDQPIAPFVLPMGDLTDIRSYAPPSLFAYQESGLSALRQRYGTTEVFLATAEPQGSDILFGLYSTENGTPAQVTLERVSVQQGLDPYRVGAEKLLAFLNSDWKSKTIISPVSNANEYSFAVRFSGLPEWIALRNRIQDIPDIDQVKVKSVSPQRAELSIFYRGTIDGLNLLFNQYGIGLAQTQSFTNSPQANSAPFGFQNRQVDQYGRPMHHINAQPQVNNPASYEIFMKPNRY